MNGKLQNLMSKLAGWCHRHGVDFDLTCDEDDLQGALVFRRFSAALPRLRAFLAPLLARDGIHERAVTTRAGTVLLFSLAGISEDVVARFRDDLLPAYVGDVDKVLLGPAPTMKSGVGAGIAKEGRYVFPSKRSSIGRSTWPNFSNNPNENRDREAGPLAEALQGIAAKYDPNEVKQALGSILRDLGLDVRLKQAGIKNKISDDGQYVIFYNIDQNGQPQPIIRYELAELGEESKMYEALDFLSDLAKKEAPGTGKQVREKQREQERAMRQLIKSELPRRPEDGQQGDQSLLNPAQTQPQLQPIGGAKGGGFPVLPEAAGRVTDINFRGRIAAALLG